MAYFQLPETHRYKARHDIRELGWLPRLTLFPVLMILAFGSMAAVIMATVQLLRAGSQPPESLSDASPVVVIGGVLIFGLAIPLLAAPLCKLGLLRMWNGRGKLCWISSFRAFSYVNATDSHLYLTRLEFWAANLLPHLVTAGVLYALLMSGSAVLMLSAIASLPLRVASFIFPLINLLVTLRYPRHSLFCEASCGGYEVYSRVPDAL